METILIDVYLPAAGHSFEIRVPQSMNSLLAAHLTADALSPLTGGAYFSSRTSVFAWRGTGRLLDMRRSLGQEKVVNGSKLLLI